jgi:predicted ATP-dependent serine protease
VATKATYGRVKLVLNFKSAGCPKDGFLNSGNPSEGTLFQNCSPRTTLWGKTESSLFEDNIVKRKSIRKSATTLSTDLADERFSSGVEGLDDILAGGLARAGFYLVQGDPGKTNLHGLDEYSRQITDSAGALTLTGERWNLRKVRFFWTSLKHSRPGPNYR